MLILGKRNLTKIVHLPEWFVTTGISVEDTKSGGSPDCGFLAPQATKRFDERFFARELDGF
jgi:hypothetical protein